MALARCRLRWGWRTMRLFQWVSFPPLPASNTVAATRSSGSSSNINLWCMNAPRVSETWLSHLTSQYLFSVSVCSLIIWIDLAFSGAGLQAELRRIWLSGSEDLVLQRSDCFSRKPDGCRKRVRWAPLFHYLCLQAVFWSFPANI